MPGKSPPRRWQALVVVFAFLPLGATAPAAPAGAATSTIPSLAGLWRAQDGTLADIIEDASAGTFDSQMLNDTCDAGPRSFLVRGTATGTSIEGTLAMCDPQDSKLANDCGLEHLWETPFTANFTDREIVGERRGEYFTFETNSQGNYTNCTFDHYTQNSFTLTRADCRLKSLEALGELHVADEVQRADEVARAHRMEDGEALQWTDANLEAGGLKEKAEAFKAGLLSWGYTGRINSAYRPIPYQGHFADMRRCALDLVNNLRSDPEVAPFLTTSLAALKAEVAKHAIKSEQVTVVGVTVPVPFVCWQDPLTLCPHVDARAVDMTIVPDDNSTLEWIGAMYGFCRPYRAKDRPHWDYVGDYAFGVEKCKYLGTGPGEATVTFTGKSPVNLKVEDPYGNAVGYDAASGQAVNDLGESGAFYSGPGTEPQVIQIFAGHANEGNYTLTGVGTGAGAYTLGVEVADVSANTVDEASQTGTAAPGMPIAPFTYAVKADYSPKFPLTMGRFVSASSATAITWEVDSAAGPQNVQVDAAGVAYVVSAQDGAALVLKNDGATGPARVVLPAGFVGTLVTVRADGVVLNATTVVDGGTVAVSFNRPAGATLVTLDGTPGTAPAGGGGPPGGGTGPAPGAGGSTLLVVAALAAAGVGAGAFVLLRRRKGAAP